MNPGAGGAANQALSQQILRTLQNMDSKLTKENNQTSGASIFGASAAANLATGYLGRAAGAAPNVSGTLTGNMELLLGSIGNDQRMVEQVVGLSRHINDLKNAWAGLSQETRSFGINSGVAVAALGALSLGASKISEVMGGVGGMAAGMFPGISREMRGTRAVMTRAIRHTDAYQMLNGGEFGATGIRGRDLQGLGRGLGVQGAGFAINQMFGENIVGDAMMVGGAVETGIQAHRIMSNPRFMRGTPTWMRGAALATGYAGVAANVYMALPRGAGNTENRASTIARTGDPRVADEQASLGASNEYPWLIGGVVRGLTSLFSGKIDAQSRAMTDSGLGGGSFLGMMWASVRPWSQAEMQAVAQNTINPGSAKPVTVQGMELRQLTSALNFQSRQMDVGDLHAAVQSEAVRPEMEQEAFRNLTLAIERLTDEVSKQNNSGSNPIPANNPA